MIDDGKSIFQNLKEIIMPSRPPKGYKKGAEIICGDYTSLSSLYSELPIPGQTYTIRKLEEVIQYNPKKLFWQVYLNEIVNDKVESPYFSKPQEPAYRLELFELKNKK